MSNDIEVSVFCAECLVYIGTGLYSRYMIGVDEVGRGPWAGPLVVAAVRLHEPIEGLDDSKRLSATRRNVLTEQIRTNADVCVISVSAQDLDRVGLSAALKHAFVAAIEGLKPLPAEEIVIDGSVNYGVRWPAARCEPKADGTVAAVSAASIVAKVARDAYMVRAAEQFPGYGFERHVGYGTAAHSAALRQLGVCNEHRRSFRPVQEFMV